MREDSHVVARPEAVGDRFNGPVDVTADLHEKFPAYHSNFRGVNPVWAKDRATPAFSTLKEIVEPFLDYIYRKLSRPCNLAEPLAAEGEVLPVYRPDKLSPQHRHVLRISAADKEVALVGASAASYTDIHEELKGTILLKPLRHPLNDYLLPVFRKFPIFVSRRPLPRVRHIKNLEVFRLCRIDPRTRPEIDWQRIHPSYVRRGIVHLQEFIVLVIRHFIWLGLFFNCHSLLLFHWNSSLFH